MKIIIHPFGIKDRYILGKMRAHGAWDFLDVDFGHKPRLTTLVYRRAKAICMNAAISSAATRYIAIKAEKLACGTVKLGLHRSFVLLRLISVKILAKIRNSDQKLHIFT